MILLYLHGEKARECEKINGKWHRTADDFLKMMARENAFGGRGGNITSMPVTGGRGGNITSMPVTGGKAGNITSIPVTGGKAGNITSLPVTGKPRRDDSKLQNVSPIRSCTDIACCFIFFLCIVGTIAVSIIGYVHGDPRRLAYPTDSNGRFCGEGQLKERPYLFFFDLLQCAEVGATVALGCPTPQVCVSECPTTYFTSLIGSKLERETTITNKKSLKIINETRADLICRDGVDPGDSDESIDSLVRTEKCAPYYVPSLPVIGRCIPAVFKEVENKTAALHVDNVHLKTAVGEILTAEKLEVAAERVGKFNKLRDYAELLFKDFVRTWKDILIGLAVVMGVAMLWVLLLQLIVVPIVFSSLVAFIGFFVFGCCWSFKEYKRISEGNVTADFGLPHSFVSASYQHIGLKYSWLAIGVVSGTLGLIFTLVSVFVWSHIRLAIELIKEACKFILQIPLVVFWPIIPFVLQAAVLVFWLTSALYLATVGDEKYASRNISSLDESTMTKGARTTLSNVPCDTNDNDSDVAHLCEFVKYGGKEYTHYFQIFMLFMFLWLMNFLAALNQLVLAGAFTSLYWSRNKVLSSQLAVCLSLGRALRYHLGTLAFGSLLIALVQFVRIFLDLIDHKVRKSKNKCAIFLVRCLICCVWCMEEILKFFHKNAYIMVAMFGRNFCLSSKDAFLLIMRNLLQTTVVDKVVDFINIISKLLITGVAAGVGYVWFDKVFTMEGEIFDLHFSLFPVILLTVGAFLVVTVFFNVLGLAVDSLYLCYLEDLERNDGSPERPYYMSQNLIRVLGKPSGRETSSQLSNDAQCAKKAY